MSLRIKMMLALLLTGLASVAVVGGLTYASVDRKFDTIRSKQAAEHFHTFMTAYLTEYGDWKTAISTESFDHFVQRTERRQGPPDGERPSELLERMPPNIDQQSRAPRADGPPAEDGARPGEPRDEQNGRRQEPAGRRGPPDGRRPEFDDRRGPPDGARPEFDDRRGPPDGRRPDPDDRRGPPDGARPEFDDRRGPPDGRRPEFDDRRGPPDGRQPPPAERSTQADGGQAAPRIWRTVSRQAAPSADNARQTSPGPDDRPRGPEGDGDRERDAGGPDRQRQPPFRFVLTDPDYKVLLGAGQYGRDSILPTDARAKARPIEVNGKVAAYVSTEGVVTPSRQELEFLGAMRSSLAAGAAGAAVLALGLGLALGRGLSSRLSRLTSAVRAMHGGSLRQQVPVQGKDEVATLASAFNEMSEQLARSHEELQASHQTILEQAGQLRELSIRDALTNLYNRRHFDEQANSLYNQAVRHKRPLSLVIGDIDFFKKINDNYSHATGDAVLRQVGAILRQHVRLSDLVARYGGEEFVLALPETDLPQAAALCDKLRQIIEQHPWHEVEPGLKVTMSMGVFADYAVGTAEAMLQKADALLYQAKETGRNRVCHA
ncbi:diguanylate cyclase [Pseudoduganella aquatica]|uniref:diguanylate cyclase n=1 Tax=Pseudoduganella aquatica TaxID=2660641 RepID=UPI001E48E3D0|nr:diguanylate cyclase [Pseudoduganella aquatica]